MTILFFSSWIVIIRILTFQSKGSVYKPSMSVLAYVIVMAMGFQIVYSHEPNIIQVAITTALAIGSIITKGNVSHLSKAVKKCLS